MLITAELRGTKNCNNCKQTCLLPRCLWFQNSPEFDLDKVNKACLSFEDLRLVGTNRARADAFGDM